MRWTTVLSLFLFASPLEAAHGYPLETGDLVFFDLDCGKLCDAIETVTIDQLGPGPRLSHVGAIVREKKEIYIVEAWPDGGVKKTEFKDFRSRVSSPEAGWFAYAPEHLRKEAKAAAFKMLKYIGRPYDPFFFYEDEKFYCSELVYEGWKSTKRNPFELLPMDFGKLGSRERRVWDDYYSKLQTSTPQDYLGLSPLGIFLAAKKAGFRIENFK